MIITVLICDSNYQHFDHDNQCYNVLTFDFRHLCTVCAVMTISTRSQETFDLVLVLAFRVAFALRLLKIMAGRLQPRWKPHLFIVQTTQRARPKGLDGRSQLCILESNDCQNTSFHRVDHRPITVPACKRQLSRKDLQNQIHSKC